MSSFTTDLIVSPIDGRHWRLVLPFTYHLGSEFSNIYISVKAGAVTDFASFPTIIWRGLMWWLPYWAKYSKPSVLHDHLYRSKQVMGMPITRKQADLVFYDAMLVAWRKYKLGKPIAKMEYFGVRLFGGLAWKY